MAVATLLLSLSRAGHGQWPLFYMERPTATLDSGYEVDEEERKGPFIEQTRQTTTARHKLELRTRGYIYHPALLVYSIGLRPEFKQQHAETTGTVIPKDEAKFVGYFVDMTLLQLKPYTVNLFASRERGEFKSSLAPDAATESSLYRGRLLLKYPILPTTVTLERSESLYENFFSGSEKADTARLESSHKTEASRTAFKAESVRQTRSIGGSGFTTERSDTTLSNSYTPSRGLILTSSARFGRNSSELSDFANANVATGLALHHSEKFSTRYDLRLDKREGRDFSSDSRSVSAGLTHLLYENLTTNLNASGTQSRLSAGGLDAYGGNLSFLYRRRIPWGHVSANLGRSGRIEDDRRTGAFTEVRGETLILSATTPVLLVNVNADVPSIVVKNAAETIIYVEGIDYVLSAVGRSVAIARTLFGGIADGREVLVDYRYQALPPAKTAVTTDSVGFDLSLWSALRLYYQRSRSKQRLLSDTRAFEPFDDTVERFGAEFNWKWSTTRVEVEDRDSTRTPSKRRMVQQVLRFQPSRDLSFGFSVDASELTLKETGDVSESTGARANLRWRPSPAAWLSVEALAQRSRGRAQDTDVKGLSAAYEWTYGAWQPSLRYLFLDELNGLSGDARKRQTFLFQVRREFR